MRLPRWWLAAWILIFAAPSAPAAVWAGDRPAGDEADSEFFERKIRPLLVQRCYACHGRGRKKGGLSLESRETMLAGGDSGTAVALGKPDESLLIEAVEYAGDVQMPPSGKLAAEEIDALKQWLAGGAPWPAGPADAASMRSNGTITQADRQFWSFQPVRDPQPPAVRQADWPRRPLDHFVLARLEAEGLQPVCEADRRTFIRRATFDLIGLPPTAEEVEAFAADERPDAYERSIERLLDSPHYGERWARHWLDVARFGEDQAHTFQARLYTSGYRYRDWVIEAFNRDLPFDRFVTEQIAGDLIDDAGGDRTSRLAALGFFALGPVYYADNACGAKAKLDEYDDRVDTLARGFLGLTVACARCHDHKFDPISMRDYYSLAGIIASSDYYEAPLAPADVVARYDAAQAKVKQAEEELKEARALESRNLSESFAPQTARYLVAVWRLENRRKVDPQSKLSAMAEDADLNEAVLERWQRHLAADRQAKHPLLAAWRELLARQDSSKDLSADPAALAEAEQAAKWVQAIAVLAVNQRRMVEEQYAAHLAMLKEGEPRPEKPDLEKSAADILKYFVDDRNAPLAPPKELVEKLLPEEGRKKLATMQAAIEELKKAVGEKYPIAHSLKEGQAANMPIHLRGSPTDLGDEAPRGFLAVLSPADARPFEQGSGRLELARAIADRNNPLTARVFVNRVWQQHFGRGIVGTPSNFGLLGERPTHPELLDYLASRFIASGWSIKSLQREIMLSATYRLASTWQAAQYERDPDNRFYWRMNRRRLDVESWRDALLAACGNLDPVMGGPSQKLDDASNRRRTLYAAVSRHELNPVLRLFDFPDPNLTSERRVITTVPMQQLFVLNSEFMIGQAKTLAARLLREPSSEDARVERIYRWVFGRPPRERERQLAREFLAGTSVVAGAVKLSPWEQYAQALLGSNEFVFVD
ncbi:MAG TPA: PSD1 and planctomycete cytochrome C domain-containing protein [Pirellulales bacterium]|nr:PSD1 and planctomycete cytochrome C domain-containing protein [Pirellulales bacterium]